MWTIQALNHEEGSCAMWFELPIARFDTRDEARAHLRYLRSQDDEDSMYSYRITEVGSDEYYSQPTDRLKY